MGRVTEGATGESGGVKRDIGQRCRPAIAERALCQLKMEKRPLRGCLNTLPVALREAEEAPGYHLK